MIAALGDDADSHERIVKKLRRDPHPAHLSGLAALVWQPDLKTLERREVFSAYQSVVKESTRLKQQIKSTPNAFGVACDSPPDFA